MKSNAKTKRSEEEYGQFFLNDGSSVKGDKKKENMDLYFSTLRSSNLSKLQTVLTFHLRGSTGRLAGHCVLSESGVTKIHTPWSTGGTRSPLRAGQSQELQ